ncbi:HEPN family nuclease [Lacipirellula sp.]|uniref:HEPN family nuclease n=1 Tax=Lacipirellula sp. TaxID=2691419 RepID=UPI003D10CFED
MGCADQFEIDFIKSTRDMMVHYPRPYDPTMLLNCSVGLLIMSRERMFDRIPTCPLKGWGGRPGEVVDFGPSLIDTPDSVRNFMRQLRNCLCHSCFTLYHENGQCAGVHFKSNMKNNSFEARLSLKSLKYLMISLAHALIEPTTVSD